METWAHSCNGNGFGIRESLRDHLYRVAERTAAHASAFGAEQQGQAAGLLHDLGKYAKRFQNRLNDPTHVHGCDHWTAGALAMLAATKMKRRGIIPALAIRGHHIGLGDAAFNLQQENSLKIADLLKDAWKKSNESPSSDNSIDHLGKCFIADGLPSPTFKDGLAPAMHSAADMLDARMFFSALVDADFLETEAHFAGDAETPYCPRLEGPTLDVDRAIASLEEFLTAVRKEHGNSPMASTRDQLQRDCLDATSQPQGLFSLSAPTGMGKTLSMLAFALHHAKKYGLRRIVVVMPFLNILDQTAKIYRTIFSEANGFPKEAILEHHSLADYGDDSATNDGVSEEKDAGDDAPLLRLLAENWDAPIILTTNVQFFESLMAERPSRCRKLHRLARSVILCDEVQTLPTELAVATLATLSRLADPDGPYHASVVFSTATQPAFDALNARIATEFTARDWKPEEIVKDAPKLYGSVAGRVCVQWRHKEPITLEELSLELQKHKQVLCIVNLKRHAARLVELLCQRGLSQESGLLHLSTNMCPAHREKTLDEVRRRLEQGLPMVLIATQCVEAGVDLDFPVVYRALAPLDAIAQAAGRCNRHNLGPAGQMVVFKPQDDRRLYPPGYEQAVDATESFLNGLALKNNLNETEILNDPRQIEKYFRYFYSLTGRDSTEAGKEHVLLDAMRASDFATVAEKYKLIQSDTIRVLTPYNRELFETLCDEVDAEKVKRFSLDYIRKWTRQAAPLAVNLFRPKESDAIISYLQPIWFTHRRDRELQPADWFHMLPDLKYDKLQGISTEVAKLWIV